MAQGTDAPRSTRLRSRTVNETPCVMARIRVFETPIFLLCEDRRMKRRHLGFPLASNGFNRPLRIAQALQKRPLISVVTRLKHRSHTDFPRGLSCISIHSASVALRRPRRICENRLESVTQSEFWVSRCPVCPNESAGAWVPGRSPKACEPHFLPPTPPYA